MRALMIAAALAFTAAAPVAHAQSSAAAAQALDKSGQCNGPDGKDATNAKCKGAGPAPTPAMSYTKDSKGQCRDGNGKAVEAVKCKAA
jgi:hypothetical protein